MSESPEGSPAPSLRTVGRNTGALFGSQSITWVLSAVELAVLPRFVGPELLGQFAVALSLWAIVSIVGTLGTTTLVTLESARAPEKAGRIIGPVVRARLLSGVVGWVFVVGFGTAVGYPRNIVLLAALVGVAFVLAMVADAAGSALIGLERMGTVARAMITSRVVSTALIIAAVVVTRSVYVVAAVGIVPAVLKLIMLFGGLRRATDVHFDATWAEVRSAVRRGAPYLLAGVALITYQQVDVIVMALLVDEVQIGWYGAADRLFGTLLFAPAILTTALLPALTREHARDPAAASAMLARAFDLLAIIAVPVGLIALISADQFTLLLFGDDFAESGPVLAVLGLVLMMTFFSILFGSYAFAVGRQMVWNILMVCAIGASILLDLVLVPWTDREFDNGAIGGALAYVVTETAMVVFGLWKIAPQIVNARRLARIAKCVVAGGCFLAASWFIRDRFFLLPSLAGMAAYLVAVVGLRAIDRDEITAITRLVPWRRGSQVDVEG